MEEHYNFKGKCLCTEQSVAPFVAENVKLSLKEIRGQIIQSEEGDYNDRNVCRLCLGFSDSDMTLSASEQEQFNKWFPEVVSLI